VPGASGAGWQELTGAPRAHFQIDGPRTVALRKLTLDKIKVLFEVYNIISKSKNWRIKSRYFKI
jgi:hypothetical protein